MAGGARGRCRLAALPSIAAYLLPRALATFQRQYPGVEGATDGGRAGPTPEWVQQSTVILALSRCRCTIHTYKVRSCSTMNCLSRA